MKDYPLVSTLMILEQYLEQAFGQDIPVIPCDVRTYGTKTSSDVQALVFLPDLSSQSLAQVGNIATNIVFHVKTSNVKVMLGMIRAVNLDQKPGDTSSLAIPQAVQGIKKAKYQFIQVI